MKSTELGKGVVLGVTMATLAAPQLAHAGGLFAGDAGSQAQSRAGAFVAKADDPTALMHNPAGLVKAKKYEIFVGANLVHFNQSFDRDGAYQHWVDGPPSEPSFEGEEMPEVENSGPIQPIPFLAGTQRFGKLALGEGIFAPQGYPNRDMPETVDVGGVQAPAPQRYDMISQESLAALPSIGAAYRITDQLDVGLRLSWGFSTLKARTYLWGSINHTEDRESDAIFTADVSDSFVPGFGAGLLYRPTASIEIGAAYSSEITLDMKGTGTATLGSRLNVGGTPTTIGPVPDDFALCEPGGSAGALKACITLVIPQTATAGARYIWRDRDGAEKGDVELDVRWENWAAATDITIIVDAQIDQTLRPLDVTKLRHGFQDVISVRLGGSYAFPMGSGQLTVRGGASYDTAAAPDSWSRLDLDGSSRLQFAGGAAYGTRSWRIDLGGSAILSPERTVAGPDPFTPPATADQPPQQDRTQPDATNPQSGENNQELHPINNGTFKSGYIIIATGVTFMF